MSFLEEHSYVSSKNIKVEPEKTELRLEEINIKMECDELLNDELCVSDGVNPLKEVENNQSKVEDKLKATLQKKFVINSRHHEQNSEDEGIMDSALNASGLTKACILQTCLNLLDSSSSDEDELMLLWLLCSKRKKKLRKRRKL